MILIFLQRGTYEEHLQLCGYRHSEKNDKGHDQKISWRMQNL